MGGWWDWATSRRWMYLGGVRVEVARTEVDGLDHNVGLRIPGRRHGQRWGPAHRPLLSLLVVSGKKEKKVPLTQHAWTKTMSDSGLEGLRAKLRWVAGSVMHLHALIKPSREPLPALFTRTV